MDLPPRFVPRPAAPLPTAPPLGRPRPPVGTARVDAQGAQRTKDPRRPGLASASDRQATDLMLAFRESGDPRDFEALYAATQHEVELWVRSLIARSGAGPEPAELVQETFLAVFRYPHSFRAEHGASFRVWVRTIAGNALRRSRRRGARPVFQDLPSGPAEPEDRAPGPARCAEEGEARVHLEQAYLILLAALAAGAQGLSERDQRALFLVDHEGNSHAEAAQRLGVRAANLKMILFRARRRLMAHAIQALGVRGCKADLKRSRTPARPVALATR